MIRPTKFLAAFALLYAFAANLPAQSIYATLTGVVSDPSQGLVVQATVRLRNEQSGSLRETVTNREGYYTFASVPVGTYELTVEAPGFETYKETGIALGGGEKRNVNVTLKVGSTTESVVVTGTADLLTPVDSGEKSTTLTVKQLENFVRWEAMPPSSSRSCPDSASRTEPPMPQTTAGRRSASMPTAMPEARAR